MTLPGTYGGASPTASIASALSGGLGWNPYASTSQTVAQQIAAAQSGSPKPTENVGNPIPYSSDATALRLQYENAYKAALAKLPNQLKNAYAVEGFNVDVSLDANGNPSYSHIGVNAANPYGSYQQNRRSSALAQMLLSHQNAGNNLHGGLANQGLNDIRYQTGLKDYAMLGRLEANKNAAIGDYQASANSYHQNIAYLDWQQTQRNIAEQNFTPAATTNSPQDSPASNPSGPPLSNAEKLAQMKVQKALKTQPVKQVALGLNNMLSRPGGYR